MLRIFKGVARGEQVGSLLNLQMFNSIIMTYFTHLLMENLVEVCCNFMLEGPVLMQAEVCQLLLFILP